MAQEGPSKSSDQREGDWERSLNGFGWVVVAGGLLILGIGVAGHRQIRSWIDSVFSEPKEPFSDAFVVMQAPVPVPGLEEPLVDEETGLMLFPRTLSKDGAVQIFADMDPIPAGGPTPMERGTPRVAESPGFELVQIDRADAVQQDLELVTTLRKDLKIPFAKVRETLERVMRGDRHHAQRFVGNLLSVVKAAQAQPKNAGNDPQELEAMRVELMECSALLATRR